MDLCTIQRLLPLFIGKDDTLQHLAVQTRLKKSEKLQVVVGRLCDGRYCAAAGEREGEEIEESGTQPLLFRADTYLLDTKPG